MLRKKQGFTLVELIVTIGLSLLVLAAIFALSSAVFNNFSVTTELSNAQVNAHTTLKTIEQKIRDADYLNVETSYPSQPNENYSYIYNDNHQVKASGSFGESVLAEQEGVYWQKVSYSRVNDKIIKLTVSVYKGDKIIYKLSSNVKPNNLMSNNITGVAQGECISYKVNVSTFLPVSGIEVLSESSFINTNGQTMTFTANVLPENASIKSVAWSVSDMSVARISQEGVLTPLRNGFVTVIATAMDGSGKIGQKHISISNQKTVITDLKLISSTGSNELKRGGYTLTILPIITPEDADNKTITWSIDDTSIATIDQNGVLTSKNKSNRSVMITAQTNDGSGFVATIEIKIVD